MQDDAIVLHKAISKTISLIREDKGVRYTDLCFGYDIPTSTFDDIMSAKRLSSFYSIAKVIKALGLSFEEFGALLDKELPENFMDKID